MQWIVDIVKFKLASYLKGKIFLWSGAIIDIPIGFALCNGFQGTPDLRDKFIVGAGNTYNPADGGGAVTHSHSLIATDLSHTLIGGLEVDYGINYDKKTETHELPGTAFFRDGRPLFYALAFIMKL